MYCIFLKNFYFRFIWPFFYSLASAKTVYFSIYHMKKYVPNLRYQGKYSNFEKYLPGVLSCMCIIAEVYFNTISRKINYSIIYHYTVTYIIGRSLNSIFIIFFPVFGSHYLESVFCSFFHYFPNLINSKLCPLIFFLQYSSNI